MAATRTSSPTGAAGDLAYTPVMALTCAGSPGAFPRIRSLPLRPRAGRMFRGTAHARCHGGTDLPPPGFSHTCCLSRVKSPALGFFRNQTETLSLPASQARRKRRALQNPRPPPHTPVRTCPGFAAPWENQDGLHLPQLTGWACQAAGRGAEPKGSQLPLLIPQAFRGLAPSFLTQPRSLSSHSVPEPLRSTAHLAEPSLCMLPSRPGLCASFPSSSQSSLEIGGGFKKDKSKQ